jgi:DNA-directed RNA polymerase subunit RPC12/RpoP
MKTYKTRVGREYIDTYGFKCGNCGQPLPTKYGHSKALIKFNHIRCTNCKKIIRNIEFESGED